jgi:hypothetical protein
VFRIGFVVVTTKPRIGRREAADVYELTAHFHRTVDCVDVVQHHLHFAVAAAQRDAAPVFDEFAAKQHVLQVEVAGEPPERVDGGEVPGRILGGCGRQCEGQEDPEDHEPQEARTRM